MDWNHSKHLARVHRCTTSSIFFADFARERDGFFFLRDAEQQNRDPIAQQWHESENEIRAGQLSSLPDQRPGDKLTACPVWWRDLGLLPSSSPKSSPVVGDNRTCSSKWRVNDIAFCRVTTANRWPLLFNGLLRSHRWILLFGLLGLIVPLFDLFFSCQWVLLIFFLWFHWLNQVSMFYRLSIFFQCHLVYWAFKSAVGFLLDFIRCYWFTSISLSSIGFLL